MNILFLCTGNSCRSQIAEAWANSLCGEKLKAYSAGYLPKDIDPMAIRVMSEVGLDISKNRSKKVEDLHGIVFDIVVTVCDSAKEKCPFLPGNFERIYCSFDDPPSLAKNMSETSSIEIYRRVRDEIRAFVIELCSGT